MQTQVISAIEIRRNDMKISLYPIETRHIFEVILLGDPFEIPRLVRFRRPESGTHSFI